MNSASLGFRTTVSTKDSSKTVLINMWMLGIYMYIFRERESSHEDPLTGFESQVNCMQSVCVFAEQFLAFVGYMLFCSYGLQVAHGSSRHCCDICKKYMPSTPIYAFAQVLVLAGPGLHTTSMY